MKIIALLKSCERKGPREAALCYRDIPDTGIPRAVSGRGKAGVNFRGKSTRLKCGHQAGPPAAGLCKRGPHGVAAVWTLRTLPGISGKGALFFKTLLRAKRYCQIFNGQVCDFRPVPWQGGRRIKAQAWKQLHFAVGLFLFPYCSSTMSITSLILETPKTFATARIVSALKLVSPRDSR